jgi:stage II sporulation protein M
MKQKNFFAENYSKSWKFLREARWYVVFALGIFSLLFLIGFAFPIFFQMEIFNFLANLSSRLDGKGAGYLFGYIFLNNLRASFLAIFLGVFFGVVPLVNAITNGYLIGFVSRYAVNQGGIFILWRLLPHGIFELPAVIMSIGIGLKIGIELFKKDFWKRLKYNLKEGLRFFVFVVIPLLLIAAAIESLLVVGVG